MTNKIIKQYLSSLGKKGGEARAKKLTPERRKEIATQASKSRKIIKDKLKQ